MINLATFLSYTVLVLVCKWIYDIIYSMYFSPLSKIPGPMIVHFFPNYIRKISAITGKTQLKLLELHNKYGGVVRMGGDMVTFVSDEAAKQIYSSYNFKKGQGYNIFEKVLGESIFSTQDKEFHRQRKKIMASSFSEKSILGVEYLVKRSVDNLVKKIDGLASENISFDIGKYFHYFTFDVIGDVAYGESFDMLEKGHHPILDWVKDTFVYLGAAVTFPFLKYYQPECVKKFYEFSYEAVKNSKSHPDRVTILNALLNAKDPETGEKLSEKEIVEESIIQLIAGTDTTSNSLAWSFYYLCQHPEIYSKVRTELKSVFPNNEPITYIKCKSECHYLSAVIYESLRILPVVGHQWRITPQEGKVIDGYFIPGGTSVGVSVLCHHNHSNNWKDSDQFIPERWLDEQKKFKNNTNFMPFLIGPRACLGRTLAWMELYLATAALIRNFKFELKSDKQVDSLFFVVNAPKTPVEVIAKK